MGTQYTTEVRLIEGPLPEMQESPLLGAGAVLTFDGVVRPEENGRPLAALVYDAYEPMTTRELERLAVWTAEQYELLAVQVHHSRGRVPVGKVAFRLRILARHRKEAIVALDVFIDRLKRDVPLWKRPEWLDGRSPAQEDLA